MGINKEARWNGLKILIPKHMWKSKIRLLEQKLDENRYVTFFYRHPVGMCLITELLPTHNKLMFN